MTLIDDVLEGLRLESSVFCRMTLSGQWGFAKSALNGAPFHLLLSGRASLIQDGVEEELALEPGDIVVLPRGQEHQLLSSREAVAVPFREVANSNGLAPWTPGTRYKSVDLRFGSGSETTTLISGIFAFGDHRRNPLLAALPSVLLVRANSDTPAATAVASITSLLDAELLSGMPGASSVGARLADILFIQVVRHYLSSAGTLPQGWLRGVGDRAVAPALAAMHRAPEQPWSVATLAREAGMSRSRFAVCFHAIVGQTPLEYLTHWRMYQAAARLAEGGIALPAVAASVGYRSEVSFSKAFKRWAGRSPADYRRQVNLQPDATSKTG